MTREEQIAMMVTWLRDLRRMPCEIDMRARWAAMTDSQVAQSYDAICHDYHTHFGLEEVC